MKLEQHGIKVRDEKNWNVLKELPDGLSVERCTLSILIGVRFHDVGKAPARIEEDQEKVDAVGTHALAANLRSQGGGQGGRGGGT